MPVNRDVPESLAELRREIEEIDRSLVVLIAARLEAAQRAIAVRSARTGRVADPGQEHRVLLRAQRWSRELDVPESIVVPLIQRLLSLGKERSRAARAVSGLRGSPEGSGPKLVAVPLAR
jgi:chorismate mutase